MFEWNINNADGYARAGEFLTEHGVIKTPIFMPVGTKASVKGISREELDEMGAQIILNNTYHLYLRPGDKLIKDLGGVHKFQNYTKPILTDSGGFQVFSLGVTAKDGYKNNESLVKITEDGVHFRSVIDGSKHYFTPASVMDIESNLGADIIMAFDECASGDSSYEYAKAAMERTHRWADRCVLRRQENNKIREKNGEYLQALFPIVQGVVYDDLRRESARYIGALPCPGIAIGGLSVGESKEDMYRILDVLKNELPENKPRYLMGVGTPIDLVEGIARGIDMFDCVLPTRLGRHGVAFSYKGNIKLTNEKFKFDLSPIDSRCNCKVCRNHTRAYLRHLIQENEIEGMSLLSYHNLYFLINLASEAREAILENRFEKWREEFYNK